MPRVPVRKADPRSDPRFQRVVEKVSAASKKLKQHPPAAKKANEPAKAAKAPPNEKTAGASAKQVQKLDETETPKPKPQGFLEMLQAEIAKAMPKTLGDTEKFMKGGSSEQMKGSLKGEVSQEKDASTGDLKKTAGAKPSEAGVPAKEVVPIAPEPTAAPAPVNGAEAMPAPKPDAEVSLQDSKADVQGELTKNKLSDDRLKKANDPRFSAVISSKQAVGKQADAGPAQYRAKEAGVLGQAAAKAVDVAKKGAVTMLHVKGGSKAKVQSRQEQQKAKEELELKTFTDFVTTTFQNAKTAVDKRLEALDTKVNDLFDKGVERALSQMKTYVEDKLFKYKLERYLGSVFGAALWIKDQFLDLPDEVNRFYEAGRALFTRLMNALAVQVASLVESELAAAKREVKTAQQVIAAKTATLSPGVKARGAKLQAEFNEKFAELESGIEDKKQQLAEGLAQKYKEAFDKADESLKAIQDENKGLVTKAKEAIAEVLAAIEAFKTRLLGVLKKGADTLDLILADPIQFLSYLLAAIKQGFNQFIANIGKHLAKGFITWLFGALTKMGIELPSDLSLPSILKLVLGVLGITYARMRAKAVKLLGNTAVTVIEKVGEYIYALITGGVAALWEKVKEDLSNLKAMVIDAVQDWIITTIMKKAVAKIVSMFNPAGAIIQAILLIVDVVVFVVTKANQILDFVEAVVNSIAAIASGAIGAAANWIEQSLGKMVPLLIGFLADLIGLGGVSEKIKEFIKKVQDKVDKAIDKAIAKVVEVVKKLIGAVKAGAKKLLNWWKKKVAVSGGGESHTLTFDGTKKSAHLVLKSTPMPPADYLRDRAKKLNVSATDQSVPVKSAEIQQKDIADIQKKLAPFDDNDDKAATGKDEKDADKLMSQLDGKLATLGTLIGSTVTSWGGKDQPVKKLSVPRPSFTFQQKYDLAQAHIAQQKGSKKGLKLDSKGNLVNLAKGLARRHVVSSSDMSKHYVERLLNKKWSEAKTLLEQRASIPEAKTKVNEPLSDAAIQDAAVRRHSAFFGFTKNLFIGDSKENSRLQENLDTEHPEMSLKKNLYAHVARIKRSWALDSNITIHEE